MFVISRNNNIWPKKRPLSGTGRSAEGRWFIQRLALRFGLVEVRAEYKCHRPFVCWLDYQLWAINHGQILNPTFIAWHSFRVVLVFRYTVRARNSHYCTCGIHSSQTLPEANLPPKCPSIIQSSVSFMNVVVMANIDTVCSEIVGLQNFFFLCSQICHSQIWPDFKEH